MHESTGLRLTSYPSTVRQLIVTGLGREAPTVIIITNDDDDLPTKALIAHYARRMTIEQRLAEIIQAFHADAVAGVIALLLFVVMQLRIVVIPLAVALLLAALLLPAVRLLTRARLPRGVAIALVLVGGLALLAGVVTLVSQTVVNELPNLSDRLDQSIRKIQQWLTTGPLHLDAAQLNPDR